MDDRERLRRRIQNRKAGLAYELWAMRHGYAHQPASWRRMVRALIRADRMALAQRGGTR